MKFHSNASTYQNCSSNKTLINNPKIVMVVNRIQGSKNSKILSKHDYDDSIFLNNLKECLLMNKLAQFILRTYSSSAHPILRKKKKKIHLLEQEWCQAKTTWPCGTLK